MYNRRGSWYDEGSAESAVGALLPPLRHIARNTKTGQRKIVLINTGQTFGDAVRLGQWEAEPRNERQNPPTRPAQNDEPRRKQAKRSRKMGSRSSSTAGDSASTGLGLRAYAAALAVFGLAGTMASWAYNNDHLILWGIGVILCLITGYWAFQAMAAILGVLVLLALIVYIPKATYNTIQSDKAANARRIQEADEEGKFFERARKAAQLIEFTVTPSGERLFEGLTGSYSLGMLTRADQVVVAPLGGRPTRISLHISSPFGQAPMPNTTIGLPLGVGSRISSGYGVNTSATVALDARYAARFSGVQAAAASLEVTEKGQAYRVTIICAVGAPLPPCRLR